MAEITPERPTLPYTQRAEMLGAWQRRYSDIGLTGVIALPNTTFEEWLMYYRVWIEQFGKNMDNFNQDFDDFVAAYNEFVAGYHAEVAETRGLIVAEAAGREEADKNLQDEINAFNTNAGFNFGREQILTKNFDESISEVGGEIPSYYDDKINGSPFSSIPQDNFNVGFITDAHFQYGQGNYALSDAHFAYAGAIARSGKLDAVVAGGDNVNGDHNRKNKYNEAVNVTETLLNRVPDETDVFFMLGNHDTGIGQSAQTNVPNLNVADNLDEKTIKKLYRTGDKLFGEMRNDDSLYGFKDYSAYKIRLIFLNAFDLPFTNTNGVYDWNFLQNSGFQNAQLNWLANTALKVPDATWQVIVFSHAPISGSFATIAQENTDALLGILKAYKTGTSFSLNDNTRKLPVAINVDYSAQNAGTLIAFVSGHVHKDGQMVYQGLNLIQTNCSWSNNIQNAARVDYTITEDAQDVYSINRTARKIFIYRLGYGIDREFTY